METFPWTNYLYDERTIKISGIKYMFHFPDIYLSLGSSRTDNKLKLLFNNKFANNLIVSICPSIDICLFLWL